MLDWRRLHTLAARGVAFATLTHAAGLSSTGDAALDVRLPFDEPYHLPAATVRAIATARRAGGRVIALGTTVTRALEHAGSGNRALRAGDGVATQRLGAHSRLRVVDAIVSGTHEPGSSHRELLRAFAGDAVLARVDAVLQANGYLTHEFGNSVLVERAGVRRRGRVAIDRVALSGARESPAHRPRPDASPIAAPLPLPTLSHAAVKSAAASDSRVARNASAIRAGVGLCGIDARMPTSSTALVAPGTRAVQ